MNDYEALESLGYIVSFVTNIVIARICFSAYLRTDVRPFLFLGICGSLTVISLLIDFGLMRNQQDQSLYATLWLITTVLWIVDTLLFVIGVSGLIAHYASKSLPEDSPS